MSSSSIGALAEKAQSHRAVSHELLVALASGALPDPKLALLTILQTYRTYSVSFVDYLDGVIANAPAAWAEELTQNKMEEMGEVDEEHLQLSGLQKCDVEGIRHTHLFTRMLKAMETAAGRTESAAVSLTY